MDEGEDMGVYWIEAEETAAAAIARSENRGCFDRESLSMAGFRPDELAALWDIIRGTPGDSAAIGHELASDGVLMTSVARVAAEFVRRLAELKEPEIEPVARQWTKFDGFAGCDREWAVVVLRELASFAECAWHRGNSVLQVTDER
jgi:hypothetical protein